jgi:hypothetical protein
VANPLTRLVALARAKPMLAVAAGGVGLAVAVPAVSRLRQGGAGGEAAAGPGVATARPLPGDPGDLWASERAGQNANIANAIAAHTRAILGGMGTVAAHGPTVGGPAVPANPPAPGTAPTAGIGTTATPLPIGPDLTVARMQPTPEPIALASAPLVPLRSGTLASTYTPPPAPTPAVMRVAAPVRPAASIAVPPPPAPITNWPSEARYLTAAAPPPPPPPAVVMPATNVTYRPPPIVSWPSEARYIAPPPPRPAPPPPPRPPSRSGARIT